MGKMLADLNGLDIVFLACAGVGGVFLLLRLILQTAGIADHAIGVDVPDAGVDVHHADSDAGFKLVSLYGLTAFFLMFGLVGFALYRQSGLGALVSIGGGIAGGLAAVAVLGRLFKSISRLQSDGTVDMASAIGSTGTVYLTIPGNGTGRVTVNVRNRLREFDAVSHDGGEIRTGFPIKVVWVNGNTLVVERVAAKS